MTFGLETENNSMMKQLENCGVICSLYSRSVGSNLGRNTEYSDRPLLVVFGICPKSGMN